MIIYKAYKFRLYPDDIQKNLLNKNFGCARFVYNHYFNIKEDYYKKYKKNMPLKDIKQDLSNNLKDKYEFLRECDSMVLTCAVENLERAYINYFSGRASRPKPKYKGCKDSYKCNCIRSSYKNSNYANIVVDIKNKTIKLPKLGLVSIKGYRNLEEFPYTIINVTLSKESDKYYASVLVKEEITKNDEVDGIIGIDMGIKDLVITSEGIKYPSIDNSVQIRRIKGLNKALSRSEKSSNNRLKIKTCLSRAYMKMRNKRKYYIHEITKKIIDNNKYIFVEDLDIKSMIQNKETYLAASINNASWREFLSTLKYKSKWYDREYIEIDRYYPSSKVCNVCGYKNKIDSLNIREFECVNCGCRHDRDINASINILWEGLNKRFELSKIS